jgi:hypothetical protein
MAKKTTVEITETATEEVTETTKTSTPENQKLTLPPGDTGTDMLKAPHEEELEANAESVKDLGGLFEDEPKNTEEDLTGETSEEEGKEKPATEEKKEEPAPVESKGDKKEEKKVEEKKEPEKKAEPEKKEDEVKPEEKDDKPPKGFVPIAALKESRAEIKALRDEFEALKATPAPPPPQTKADEKWKDFKVLSDEEHDALIEEDPQAAIKYGHELRKFESYTYGKNATERQVRDNQKRFNDMVEDWSAKINEAVPGVYDEESEVASELADVAKELGFDNESYLEVMTDPRTLVIPHGQREPVFLGPGVMGLLKVLSNAKSKIASGVDSKELREEITKELRAEITEKVTKEITEKLKGPEGKTFKSITDVPGGGDEIETGTEILTEEDWAKLKRSNPEKADEMLHGA